MRRRRSYGAHTSTAELVSVQCKVAGGRPAWGEGTMTSPRVSWKLLRYQSEVSMMFSAAEDGYIREKKDGENGFLISFDADVARDSELF